MGGVSKIGRAIMAEKSLAPGGRAAIKVYERKKKMAEEEFPANLVERCAIATELVDSDAAKDIAWRVLRESGHAELVAALRLLWANYANVIRPLDERMIRDALKKASAL
jgi:hypothetical protein